MPEKDNDRYWEALTELLSMLADREIQPVIGARVPLAEVQRAHRLVEEGSVNGKVVLLNES